MFVKLVFQSGTVLMTKTNVQTDVLDEVFQVRNADDMDKSASSEVKLHGATDQVSYDYNLTIITNKRLYINSTWKAVQ